jgi:hypothetical protein
MGMGANCGKYPLEASHAMEPPYIIANAPPRIHPSLYHKSRCRNVTNIRIYKRSSHFEQVSFRRSMVGIELRDEIVFETSGLFIKVRQVPFFATGLPGKTSF